MRCDFLMAGQTSSATSISITMLVLRVPPTRIRQRIRSCGPVGEFAIRTAFLLGATHVIGLIRSETDALRSSPTWFEGACLRMLRRGQKQFHQLLSQRLVNA
jgi:hypothetical protein